MKGIYFKDGVYICIDTPKFNWKLSIIEVNGELESQVYLYGGRVYIDFYTGWEYPFFFIDGIPIMNEKISNKLLKRFICKTKD